MADALAAKLKSTGVSENMEGIGGVVAEIRARHGHSAQPESLQILAALQGIIEVVAAEGMDPSNPTTLFAAVMGTLEASPETRASPQVCAACSSRRGPAACWGALRGPAAAVCPSPLALKPRRCRCKAC